MPQQTIHLLGELMKSQIILSLRLKKFLNKRKKPGEEEFKIARAWGVGETAMN